MKPAVPECLNSFKGRILDIDSHEMAPVQLWVDTFGQLAAPLAKRNLADKKSDNKSVSNIPDYQGDVIPLNAETLWRTKGSLAPGAVDMKRRYDVMDMMTVARQMMFPSSIGVVALMMYGAPEDGPYYPHFKDLPGGTYGYAKKLCDAYSEWALGVGRQFPRIRPVTALYGDTPEELIAVAKRLIDKGARALMVASGKLPGGVSPASKKLDPFYAMLAEADVSFSIHIAGEASFLRSMEWGNAEIFDGYRVVEEISLNPWRLSSMHLAPQNFVATLITGAVFDRHPRLRVGVQEYCAHWVGPLAEQLDLWHDHNQSILDKEFLGGRLGKKLPMRPSEYFARNIRVSPFDFEPIDKYIERYGLEDVYCFASDYPHVEGGKDPMGSFSGKLMRLGPKVLEKFFVTNAQWLLPN